MDIEELSIQMSRILTLDNDPGGGSKLSHSPKMICHVFETVEEQFIAQFIGQVFQVTYMKFLKARSIKHYSFANEMDFQVVINLQETFGNDLEKGLPEVEGVITSMPFNYIYSTT